MATWAMQRAGNFATASDNALSPWHDGGAQTALASIPQPNDTITNAGAFDLTFDIDMPAVTSVLDTDTVNGVAGTYHAPDAAEVIDTAVFGAASAVPGTVHQPNAAEVIDTAVFGAASAVAGTWHAPDAAEVLNTATFGPASAVSGTFDESARNTDPGVAAVLYGTTYKIRNVDKTGTFIPSLLSGGSVTLTGTIEQGSVQGVQA